MSAKVRSHGWSKDVTLHEPVVPTRGKHVASQFLLLPENNTVNVGEEAAQYQFISISISINPESLKVNAEFRSALQCLENSLFKHYKYAPLL